MHIAGWIGSNCCCQDSITTPTEHKVLDWVMDEIKRSTDFPNGFSIPLSQTPYDPQGLHLITHNGKLIEGQEWIYNPGNNSVDILYGDSISNYPDNEFIVQVKYEFDTGTTDTESQDYSWLVVDKQFTNSINSGEIIQLTQQPAFSSGIFLVTANGSLLEGLDWRYTGSDIELLFDLPSSAFAENPFIIQLKYQH